MAIKLEDNVTDNITGFNGVVVSITEYQYGCRRMGLQSTELKDGKVLDIEYFDEQRLTKDAKATTGGLYDAPKGPDNPK